MGEGGYPVETGAEIAAISVQFDRNSTLLESTRPCPTAGAASACPCNVARKPGDGIADGVSCFLAAQALR
ncbi:hypothetical protein NSK11_contig00052-0002 [Nocardia seriolae]|uniref:Uncharacterized protein n=1 Tax=Nocardia seriolae TaxID=37332 RepID=A0ABC9YVA4_9NOCA|nr:hypothetical protein NSERKGN1266_06000 [Nocardia seriolae]BEK92606.1 hypothetical protein NSER024013_05120 [Nocardia seriolae]GAM47321.1 hypothetical protein NS07_v2contig00048-0001 [Nocardia seriolae]GAP29230.1 hypothetical protein NSK11_contig00052-0002 [Nocardia seriolae]GEM24952.1 hypothetical protein NS2_31910 [Nocardia seriolae NBRC 15557]